MTLVLQWDVVYYVRSCFELQIRLITKGTRRTRDEMQGHCFVTKHTTPAAEARRPGVNMIKLLQIY